MSKIITAAILFINLTTWAQSKHKAQISQSALNNFQKMLLFECYEASNRDVIRSELFNRMRIIGIREIYDASIIIQSVKSNQNNLVIVIRALYSSARIRRITLNQLFESWGLDSKSISEITDFANQLYKIDSLQSKVDETNKQNEILQDLINGKLPISISLVNNYQLSAKNLDSVAFTYNNVDSLLKAITKGKSSSRLVMEFNKQGLLSTIMGDYDAIDKNVDQDNILQQSIVVKQPIKVFYSKQWHDVKYEDTRFYTEIDSTKSLNTFVFKLGKNSIEPYYGRMTSKMSAYVTKGQLIRNINVDSLQTQLFLSFHVTNFMELKRYIKSHYRPDVVEVMARGVFGSLIQAGRREDIMMGTYSFTDLKLGLYLNDEKNKNVKIKELHILKNGDSEFHYVGN